MHKLIISYLVTILVLLFQINLVQGQDCNCKVSEVNQNEVTPCSKVVGEILTVSHTSEFWSAINQANSEGGNLTILIEDGTYDVATTSRYPYITASNLVIRSASGNRDAVILQGTGMHDVAPGTEIGIFAVGDNITIADLTIRQVGNHGIAAAGDSVFVHNVKVQDAYEQLLKVSSGQTNGTNYGRVQCSLFEYTAGIGPQWYIGGLDIHNGNYWTVNDNVFRNISSPSLTLAEHAVHFWNNSAQNVVERNMIFNCDRGVGFGLGNSSNTGGIIRNNMIYNDGQGQFDDVGIGLESSPDTKVYNNTIDIEYPNAIEYRFESTVNVSITNNLTNRLIRSRNGGQATVSNNVTNAVSTWYSDPTEGNLRLSEVINEVVDQGMDLGAEVPNDIDQTTRYYNLGYDIGAHEYSDVLTNEEVVLSNQCISLYPNPNEGIVSIGGDLQSYTMAIIDQWGQLHQTISSSGTQASIDLSNLPDGMYFLRIEHNVNGSVSLQKMIKNN